jgi:hypothetical protein
MLSRRELIEKGAVGAAATALALSAATATAAVSTSMPDARKAAGDPALPTDNHIAEAPPAPPAASGPTGVAVSSAPAPWELVRPLAAGSVLAYGWRLADLGPVRDGSCVVTLTNERGRARRVHLCRNDGSPQGIVYTRRADLVVMNEGHGDLPTEERLAQAVAALAHVVAANEGMATDRVFNDLLPHAERVQRFAGHVDGKLR